MSLQEPGASPLYHEELKTRTVDVEGVQTTEEYRANVCDDCGKERFPGDWPHCPHGDARNFGEKPLEPYFDEHISERGEWITTRGQRSKMMREGGLEYRKKRTDLLPHGNGFVDMGRGR